jgi:hypothetical protein
MANTNVDSKAYHDQVTNLAKNLSSLNAVYELELTGFKRAFKSDEQLLQKPVINDEQL